MRRVFRLPLGRARIAREIDDELTFHLEMRVQRLINAGLAPDAARAEALRQFGDVGAVRDDCVIMDEQRERAVERAHIIEELFQNTTFALRTLRRNIGFTLVIVTALSIGIGANTAIFTLINAVLVRNLPVSHPEQLVAIGNPSRTNSLSQGSPRTDIASYQIYKDLRDHTKSFTGLLATGRSGRLDIRVDSGSGELEHAHGRFVSSNYFSVLGLRALAGRVFDGTEDNVLGASPVAVISDGYWTRRFHRDPSVIGRTVLVLGTHLTIIGIAPPGFTGVIVGATTDIWLPLGMEETLHPNQKLLNDRTASWLLCLGRLEPGVTLDQARVDVKAQINASIIASSPGATGAAAVSGNPTYYIGMGARGFSNVRVRFEAPLVTLMIGVVLLLFIICANVANLLLARAVARGREMAVRLALGAERGRLVRQLLTESLILALLAAVVGVVIAWWGSRSLLALSGGAPTSLNLALDFPVLGFTLGVSIIAVLLFGLVPALRASRVDLATTMRAGAHAIAGSALGMRGQRAPLGKILIVGQVALSSVLLVGAAMLAHSLRNVQTTEVGLDRDHLVIVDLDVNARGYSDAPLYNLVHTLRDRFLALPGVAAASYSENGIFSGTESATDIELPGFAMRSASDSNVAYDQAGPGYVAAIGGHLIDGRDIALSDEGGRVRTALVNQSFARFYFPNQRAVGQFVHTQDSIAIQIVGVVGDTRDHDLEQAPLRRMYFPYAHRDAAIGEPGSLRFEIRTTRDPSALVQQIRREIVSVDASLPIDDISPLAKLMADSIRQESLLAQLATAFGGLALLLAAIGLYGVMTYAITRRTGEIGLRVALGAHRKNVIGLVLFDALRLVGVGLAIGIPLALASARLLRTQLHGVGAVDPASIGVAMAVLSASAVLAVLTPALRAARVSPIVALRAE